MGAMCCCEMKNANDEIFEAKKGDKKNVQAMNAGVVGINVNNPFKHRAGEGYDQ